MAWKPTISNGPDLRGAVNFAFGNVNDGSARPGYATDITAQTFEPARAMQRHGSRWLPTCEALRCHYHSHV
jgi:hypothetical protein